MFDEQLLPMDGVFGGMVAGDARVPGDASIRIDGMIDGDLIVEPGATVLLTGMVTGRLIDRGGHVTVRGMIGAR